MRLLLMNQFTPPDGSPTARLLGDLQQALVAAGWEVVLVGCGTNYKGGTLRGLARLRRDLLANARLLLRGLLAPRCDWVLCLSDPPGLPFTAAVVALLKRARLAHWAMDVYPQVAVALGALRPGVVSTAVQTAMRFGYRRAALLTALDEDMRRVLAEAVSSPIQVLPPWPPEVAAAASEPTPPAANQTRVWLYSGNLGRAHEYQDLLEAQRLLEAAGAPWKLVFQGGGPARAAAQQRAEELQLRGCEWTGYADEEHLLESLQQADVLIASQKPELAGLLWPSKLALMKLLNKPLLWLGPRAGEVARDVRALHPGHGVFAPGEAAAIASWLQALPPTPPPLPREEVRARVQAQRQAGLADWLRWLRD